MQVSQEMRNEVYGYMTRCREGRCRSQNWAIFGHLLRTLESDTIVDWRFVGRLYCNWHKVVKRPFYDIVHKDGRTMRVGFTGRGTIQILSKRGRSSHCYAAEFEERLVKFVGDGDA